MEEGRDLTEGRDVLRRLPRAIDMARKEATGGDLMTGCQEGRRERVNGSGNEWR